MLMADYRFSIANFRWTVAAKSKYVQLLLAIEQLKVYRFSAVVGYRAGNRNSNLRVQLYSTCYPLL